MVTHTQPLWCSMHKEVDCGYGCESQAALRNMRVWLHGYLGVHMGRKRGKRRMESSFLLLCCLMLAGYMSQTGFDRVS